MEWEKANQNMSDYLEKLIINYECRKKPMFGAPVYFVNDNMWTGVKGGKVFLRLSEDDRSAIMKEYVEIPESKLTDDKFINNWLEISYSFVKSLPPKVKKEKKSKLKKS
jgi:TfoX/Sxy family transcriptional regulator of competence genes